MIEILSQIIFFVSHLIQDPRVTHGKGLLSETVLKEWERGSKKCTLQGYVGCIPVVPQLEETKIVVFREASPREFQTGNNSGEESVWVGRSLSKEHEVNGYDLLPWTVKDKVLN